jgi:uncharacterized membrane protein
MSERAPVEKQHLAVVVASLTACMAALLAGFIYVGQSARSLMELADASYFGASFYVGFVAMVVAAVVCPVVFTLVGLPLHRLSLKRGWVLPQHYLLVGFCVSCLAAIAAFFLLPLDRALAVPLTIAAGTLATAAFWYVARPDRQAGC